MTWRPGVRDGGVARLCPVCNSENLVTQPHQVLGGVGAAMRRIHSGSANAFKCRGEELSGADTGGGGRRLHRLVQPLRLTVSVHELERQCAKVERAALGMGQGERRVVHEPAAREIGKGHTETGAIQEKLHVAALQIQGARHDVSWCPIFSERHSLVASPLAGTVAIKCDRQSRVSDAVEIGQVVDAVRCDEANVRVSSCVHCGLVHPASAQKTRLGARGHKLASALEMQPAMAHAEPATMRLSVDDDVGQRALTHLAHTPGGVDIVVLRTLQTFSDNLLEQSRSHVHALCAAVAAVCAV